MNHSQVLALVKSEIKLAAQSKLRKKLTQNQNQCRKFMEKSNLNPEITSEALKKVMEETKILDIKADSFNTRLVETQKRLEN